MFEEGEKHEPKCHSEVGVSWANLFYFVFEQHALMIVSLRLLHFLLHGHNSYF